MPECTEAERALLDDILADNPDAVAISAAKDAVLAERVIPERAEPAPPTPAIECLRLQAANVKRAEARGKNA